MKKIFAAAGLLACTLTLLATPASARTNVDVHIGIGVPGIYAQPVPVYPAPVYVQPQPVYVQPYPVYMHPQPVYVRPPHSHWHNHPDHFRNGAPYGDRDRDGIPNRWDNRPYHPYRH